MIITDAVTAGGNPKGCHAVHQTGRKPAEPAIAKGSVRFHGTHPIEIDPDVAKRRPHGFGQSQVLQDIGKQAADQELQRQVIDPLPSFRLARAIGGEPAIDDPVAQRQRRGQKPVAIGRRGAGLADRQSQFGEHRSAELGNPRLARRRIADRRQREGFHEIRPCAGVRHRGEPLRSSAMSPARGGKQSSRKITLLRRNCRGRQGAPGDFKHDSGTRPGRPRCRPAKDSGA